MMKAISTVSISAITPTAATLFTPGLAAPADASTATTPPANGSN
jgi:hypothetical protein